MKRSSSHFCFFLFSKSVLFCLGRRKEKKVCTFCGGQDVILWPTCELPSATKKPLKISNWNRTEAKKHGMPTGSYFAPVPGRGIRCDIPIQRPSVLLLEQGHTDRRKTWEAMCMWILWEWLTDLNGFSLDSASWHWLPQHNYKLQTWFTKKKDLL